MKLSSHHRPFCSSVQHCRAYPHHMSPCGPCMSLPGDQREPAEMVGLFDVPRIAAYLEPRRFHRTAPHAMWERAEEGIAAPRSAHVWAGAVCRRAAHGADWRLAPSNRWASHSGAVGDFHASLRVTVDRPSRDEWAIRWPCHARPLVIRWPSRRYPAPPAVLAAWLRRGHGGVDCLAPPPASEHPLTGVNHRPRLLGLPGRRLACTALVARAVAAATPLARGRPPR